MVEFKEYLKKEYECFNFSPPEIWNITLSTREGVNRRIYNIGDKKLADIFSEGEKKLHALSDFFAQFELEKFKGVFIRAPVIEGVYNGAEVMGNFKEKPVMVRQGNLLVTTFHPELTDDLSVHEYFIKMVRERFDQ